MVDRKQRKEEGVEEQRQVDEKFMHELVTRTNQQLAKEKLGKQVVKDQLSLFNSNIQQYKHMQKQVRDQVRLEDKYEFFPFVYGDQVEEFQRQLGVQRKKDF